jgi:hypothetical protein
LGAEVVGRGSALGRNNQQTPRELSLNETLRYCNCQGF